MKNWRWKVKIEYANHPDAILSISSISAPDIFKALAQTHSHVRGCWPYEIIEIKQVNVEQTKLDTDFILMPKTLTAENGAKRVLISEFEENIDVCCPECGGGDRTCEACCGDGIITEKVVVSWTTIKAIYDKVAQYFESKNLRKATDAENEEYEDPREENGYKPSNRDNKLASKKDKFWCGNCDAQLVGEYSKCPNCGHRNGKKRFKK